MSGARLDKADKRFLARVTELGGEVLAPTNEWELMRFRTKFGVGVVHFNRRSIRTWNEPARQVRDHVENQCPGKLGVQKVHGRRKGKASFNALIGRDGSDCFFCARPLDDDITVEHLVSVAHGGPNHLSNLFLAHQACNASAGHLSAPEKIRMRESHLMTQVTSRDAGEANNLSGETS
jgi:5-methylcytosine-specific restriction endonuclease McrA